MKKQWLLIAIALIMSACTPDNEVVQVIKGDKGDPGQNGTSCSVAPYYGEDSEVALGAIITCTDGTSDIIFNGVAGQPGANGTSCGASSTEGGVNITCGDGNTIFLANGATGATGAPGTNGQSCQEYKHHGVDGVYLKCPGQEPVLISDGTDGTSCSVQRQEQYNRSKITCGDTVSYVYDGATGATGATGAKGATGSTGAAGTSCTVHSAPGGANVTCGSVTVFLANGSTGPQGTTGPQGPQGQPGTPGRNGLNGTNGEDAVNPGLNCNLYSIDPNLGLPQEFANNTPVGNFTLLILNDFNSQSSAGLPGIPSNLQAKVGLTNYGLDCYGYLNVPVSGTYTLSLTSDDGSYLTLNNASTPTISDPGEHPPQTVSVTLFLNRGPNAIDVDYFQGPPTQVALGLQWTDTNGNTETIPASQYTHE